MSRYISENLRNFVSKRANFCCEYCKVHSQFSFFSFHIDHIISIKHGGKTNKENLALTCPICNVNKGSDIATILENIESPVRFFNPRIDIWTNHFELDDSGVITSKTDIGAATIKILDLNHIDSIIERQELIRRGLIK
ncbi:MAG: HNH endonuclease [Spirosomataceae bacterium]